MKSIIVLFLILISFENITAKELGRKYFSRSFGHLHKSASQESNSLTVVQCSHSVKLLASKTHIEGWSYVQVGEDIGYIEDRFLTQSRPECFQSQFSKFYSNMNLDITEMYYWGRLNDQYLEGRSKAR